jgi:hypothetical protein
LLRAAKLFAAGDSCCGVFGMADGAGRLASAEAEGFRELSCLAVAPAAVLGIRLSFDEAL